MRTIGTKQDVSGRWTGHRATSISSLSRPGWDGWLGWLAGMQNCPVGSQGVLLSGVQTVAVICVKPVDLRSAICENCPLVLHKSRAWFKIDLSWTKATNVTSDGRLRRSQKMSISIFLKIYVLLEVSLEHGFRSSRVSLCLG